MIYYILMSLITNKSLINIVKSFKDEYTSSDIFTEIDNKKIISKKVLEQRNENGVSLVKRRIRYMLFSLKNRGYIKKVSGSKYLNTKKINTYKHYRDR